MENIESDVGEESENAEQRRSEQGTERSLRRREARTEQTYRRFIRAVCERGGLSEDIAERAVVTVLTVLERRIMREEARHLEAQLPLRLQSLLAQHGQPRSGRVDKLSRDEFCERIASDLGMSTSEAEPVIRSVFAVLNDRVSEGEIEDVVHQLPSDWADLWTRPQ